MKKDNDSKCPGHKICNNDPMNQKHRKKKSIKICSYCWCRSVFLPTSDVFGEALSRGISYFLTTPKITNVKSDFHTTEMKRRLTQFMFRSKKKYFIESSSTLNKFLCCFSCPFVNKINAILINVAPKSFIRFQFLTKHHNRI